MMNKRSVLLTLFFTITSMLSFSQEEESVLSAPDNWQSEIIPFPLGFAQEIDFVGFEDLRFAPGWSDSTSQEFWAYAFVWYIEKDSAMTENKLTETFIMYYDGLMGVDNTSCLFTKTNGGFKGEMIVYDRFFTKSYMTLNIKVKEVFCPKTNKQIVFCDISPREFDHEVWKIFDDVTLKVECN